MLVKNRKKIRPTNLPIIAPYLGIGDPSTPSIGIKRYSADASFDRLLAARVPLPTREQAIYILSYHVEVLGSQMASTTSIYRDELTKESESLVNRLS